MENLGTVLPGGKEPSEVLNILFTRDGTMKLIANGMVLAQFWDCEEAEERATRRSRE